MNVLVAAFFSDIEKNLEKFAMNCLAVAGGYVVGYLGGGIIIGGLDKWAFKKKTPEFIKQSIRVIAGILVALLVALYVFRGGSGGEGDGGPGTGTGESQNDKKGDEPKQPAPPDRPTPEPIKLPAGKGERTIIRVTFLGGDDVTEGAFLLDDEKPAMKYEKLTEEIKKRRAATPGGVKLLLGRTGANPVERRSTGVIRLEEWAAKENIGYEWPEDVKKPEGDKK